MAEDIAYSQSRIAKNTIILFLRMLFTMGVTLYTSRVVLKVLGIDDYGIYNIIGGFVVLLAIVSNSMRSATQRFITYELGKGSSDSVSRAFSMSMIAHMIICCVVFILGETIGLWYVNTQMNIPAGREEAAHFIYQVSLFTVSVNLMRSPYAATVIAHERMSFYAYISIVEVCLQLLVVFLLSILSFDKLKIYSLLILGTGMVIFICYRFYCRRKFDTCDFHFVIEGDYFRQLFSFLGWNLFGATASLGTQQAGNLIINKFLGVAVNAAYGVSNQVNSAFNSLLSNFQVAFTPQLVKLYSQNRMKEFYELANRSALLSYYLIFLVSFPIIVNIDFVLGIWLSEVPAYAGIFSSILIIYSLIDSVQAPFWIGINATGDIKVYELWLSAILILNIPLSYFFLRAGMAPYWVLIIRVALNLITAIVRCIHVKIQLDFPIGQYLRQVVLRVLLVTVLTVFIWWLTPSKVFCTNFWRFCLFYGVSVFVIAVIIVVVGLNAHERIMLAQLVKSFVPFNNHRIR